MNSARFGLAERILVGLTAAALFFIAFHENLFPALSHSPIVGIAQGAGAALLFMSAFVIFGDKIDLSRAKLPFRFLLAGLLFCLAGMTIGFFLYTDITALVSAGVTTFALMALVRLRILTIGPSDQDL